MKHFVPPMIASQGSGNFNFLVKGYRLPDHLIRLPVLELAVTNLAAVLTLFRIIAEIPALDMKVT
jgi:hypothetical protein